MNFKIRKISAKAKGSPFGKVYIWRNKPLYSSYIRKEVPQATTGKSSSHSQKPFNGREPQTAVHDNTSGTSIANVAVTLSFKTEVSNIHRYYNS